MGTTERVLARYLSKLADTQIGEQRFGRFNLQYLQQHAKFVPKIGELFLDAERQIAAAGFQIPHEIQVLITGRGAAHALALYYAQTPPTIKVAPKAYSRGDLVHTLIHELGHYFHDKVVPNGFRNGAIGGRYRWAMGQTPTGAGSDFDATKLKVKALEAEQEVLRKDVYKFPKKGTKVEYIRDWFGQKLQAKGTVIGKGRDKWEVLIQLEDCPLLSFFRKHNMHPNGIFSERVSTLAPADPVIMAKLEVLQKEIGQLQSQAADIAHEKAPDNLYEVQFHDWVPTTYSRKNNREWFAEMFVTRVLGHLKPEPAAWLKSVIDTGKSPEGLVPQVVTT